MSVAVRCLRSTHRPKTWLSRGNHTSRLQLVEAYESGAHGEPDWASVKWFTSVQSSSNIVPVSMRSFAFRKAKEEVETENLRLRATKTYLCRSLFACCEIDVQSEGERKERAAAADSCCGRSMNTNPANAEHPSDPGSTGPKWAAEEQHWVPLFNTVPEVPTLVSSYVPRNSCAFGSWYMNGASAIPLPQAAFREMLGSHWVYGPGEKGNVAICSTVELVSLPDCA